MEQNVEKEIADELNREGVLWWQDKVYYDEYHEKPEEYNAAFHPEGKTWSDIEKDYVNRRTKF